MPNQRVQFGGPTIFEGTFLGDDATLSVVEHHGAHAPLDQGGHAVQMDASDIHGTIVVTHDPDEEIMLSFNSASPDDADFMVDREGTVTAHAAHIETTLSVDGKLTTHDFQCNGVIESLQIDAPVLGLTTGTGVSDQDDYTIPAVSTLVQRNSQTGSVFLANLRCTARKTPPVDVNGNTPDGYPPGLLMTEGSVSEQLNLIEDGRIFMQPGPNQYYRFGSEDGIETRPAELAGAEFDAQWEALRLAQHLDQDGIHFSSGVGDQLNSLQLRVSREHPTILLVGSKDDVDQGGIVAEVPTIALQNAAGAVNFYVRSTGALFCTTMYSMALLRTDGLLHLHHGAAEAATVFRITNTAEEETVTMKSSGTIKCLELQVFPDAAAAQYTGAIAANGDLDCRDIECSHVTASTLQVPLITLQPKNAENQRQRLLVGLNHADDRTFTLYDTGEMHFLHDFARIAQANDIAATVHSSIIAGDQSVYVGSSRYSYDRANHVMTLHRLKLGHIPVYLQGLNFTAANLPAGHVENDMSVRKWLVHARDHLDEVELDVKDLFPTTNADWDVIDAPMPALKADVLALQAFVTGADADITTLETEMDTAQADIVALQAASGGLGASATIANASGDAQLTIFATGGASETPEASLLFKIDDTSGSNEDREFEFRTQYGSHSELRLFTGGTTEIFRAYSNGGISFAGGNVNTGGFQCWKDARFYDTLRVAEDAVFDKSVTVTTELTISTTPILQTLVSQGVSIGVNAGDIAALEALPSVRVDTVAVTFTITDEEIVIAGNPQSNGAQAPTIIYYLPIGAYRWHGRSIRFFGDNYGSGNATIQLRCASTSPQETITAGSVGQLSNLSGGIGDQGFIVCKLKAHHGMYHAVFNANTDRWTVGGAPGWP